MSKLADQAENQNDLKLDSGQRSEKRNWSLIGYNKKSNGETNTAAKELKSFARQAQNVRKRREQATKQKKSHINLDEEI